MSQQNSLPAFTGGNLKELLDTIGVMQFTSETNWFQVLAGFIIQGGFIDNASSGNTITLNTSFPKQVLGIWLQSVDAAAATMYISTVTVDNFVVNFTGGGTKDFYWLAIGV